MIQELQLILYTDDGKSKRTTKVNLADVLGEFFKAVHSPTLVGSDYFATTGETIAVNAEKSDVVITLEEPKEGEFRMNEIAQVGGKCSVHLKVRNSKSTKIGDSEVYTLKGVGHGVRVVSYGAHYVIF